MIEEGKTYKIKKIRGLDTNEDSNNTATVLKIVKSSNKELGDVAFCNVNGERYVLPVHSLVDPENPEEYSKWSVTKLESVMKPMDLHFWKDLQEEATFSALGAAPCPAMGQVMGTTVNGIPVEGKSVKKKKKKKHEALTWVDREGVEHTEIEPRPSSTLDDIDREEYANNLEKTGWMDTPKQMFKQNKGQTDDPEFEDAINILLFGGIEDKKEYEELIELFCECGRFGDFTRLTSEKYGLDLKDLDSSNIGKDIDENFEIKWLDEAFINEPNKKITVYFSNYVENGQFVSKPLDIVIGQYYAKPGSEYIRKVTGYDPEYNNVWVAEYNPYYDKILRDKSKDYRDFENLASQEQIDFFNKVQQEQENKEQNIEHYAVMDKATGNVWTYKTREERDKKYKEVRDNYSGSDYIDVRKAYLNDDGDFVKWESVDEDFHEAYERITNLLAKQLDRMNFEYANTEEIIYKKEGAYRYLLKFDNEIGILKFKVTKDDDVIIEKEWQLDEKEDVSPIFAEIEGIYNKYGI